MHQNGVEELVVHHGMATTSQTGGQQLCVAVHPGGDGAQAFRAVVARVHGGHHGQQHLRGTDIAGGLVTADVLFAGLQREPVGGCAIGIHRHSDEASGQLPGMGGVHGQVTGVRSTESHRHAEALRGAEGDVGTDVAGRGDQGQGQQVGAHRYQCAALMRLGDERRPVAYHSGGTGQLHDDSEELAIRQSLGEIGGHHLDAEWLSAGVDHGGSLRVHIGVDDQTVGLGLHGAVHQCHRLGGGGALVEHRGIRDVQAGELGDHGLEVQQRFQAPLTDLRLVRRVGRVPGRILQDMPTQHGRGERVEVALPDHRYGNRVVAGQFPQRIESFVLGCRCRERGQAGGQAAVQLIQDAGRNRLLGELIEAGHTDGGEHGVDIGGGGTDMAIGERHDTPEGPSRAAGTRQHLPSLCHQPGAGA